MKFKENISLSKFSNYKIGGPARFFFEPKNEKEVLWALKEAKARKLKVFILGGGTNLLIGEGGFEGLVIRSAIVGIEQKGNRLTVGSGTSMARLLDYATAHSLSNLEWAGGLPGTLGGAVRGNAGCFGGEMKDSIVSVRSIDMRTLKAVTRTAKACRFGYRSSIFKQGGAKEIVISAMLQMKKGIRKDIAQAVQEKIAHREKSHPLDYPNIGSIFKNVPLTVLYKKGTPKHKKAVRELRVEFRGSAFSVKTDPFPVVAAAKLISEAGLRGVSCGGAMISPKHTNFIVNTLNADASQVQNLIVLAKAEVRRKFGVELEEEIQNI